MQNEPIVDPEELLQQIDQYTNVDTVHMYLIERKIKPGAKNSAKASEKYEYIPLQINLSEKLVPIVKEMLAKVIEKKIAEDVEIKNYSVIDDTENKIQTYHDFGKIVGFQDFLENRLSDEIKTIRSLEEIEDIEKAWALCYGFYNKDNDGWFYCIKKLSPRRMAVEIETSTSVSDAIKNGFHSLFDVDTKTLKPFNGFSLNIEPSIDLVYLNSTIYIFRKKAFEDITSLTEEFIAEAKEVIQDVEEMDFVEGIQHIATLVEKKPAFRNRLIKARAIGNIKFLRECPDVKKEFQRTGKRLEIEFKFSNNGRILAENEDQAKDIIQVLSEYYKEGIFGGKIFESPAGRLKK